MLYLEWQSLNNKASINEIMKHTIKVTLLLVFMFLAAQLIGLAIVKQYIAVEDVEVIDPETGETIIVTGLNYSALPFNMERPPIDGTQSFIYILGAILVGTLIFFLIIKFLSKQ